MSQRYTIQTPREMPEYRRAFLIVAVLDTNFYEVGLERQRIEESRERGDLKTLFADIHFILIAISNIRKGLKSLKFTLKTDQKLNALYKRFNPNLEHLDDFRDHLEHVYDGRLDGLGKRRQPLHNPGMLGNLTNDVYDFGGEQFNLTESFALLEHLYVALTEWNKEARIYPIWY